MNEVEKKLLELWDEFKKEVMSQKGWDNNDFNLVNFFTWLRFKNI